jgi:hypothetical protein
VLHAGQLDRPGVVDQCIDAAEMFVGLGQGLMHGDFIAHIHLQASALPPAASTSRPRWMVPGSLRSALLAAITMLAPSRAARSAISDQSHGWHR